MDGGTSRLVPQTAQMLGAAAGLLLQVRHASFLAAWSAAKSGIRYSSFIPPAPTGRECRECAVTQGVALGWYALPPWGTTALRNHPATSHPKYHSLSISIGLAAPAFHESPDLGVHFH